MKFLNFIEKVLWSIFLLLLIPDIIFAQEIKAYYTDSQIKLDGLLNESVWKNAVPITGFIQRELNEGEKATEKTEVRVIYNKENLYIGIICYDKEPEKIIHNELKRDGNIRSDDNFDLILDTFHDFRSGFYFGTNPNGARVDALVTSVERMNKDWNGVWYAESKITEYGWSSEIKIPFKTLRFPDRKEQIWGINFRRTIKRKNEEVLWRAWKRNDGLFQLTKEGILTGLKGVKRGRKIEIKPYSSFGIQKEIVVSNTHHKGIDIKYPLTSTLTLDLTTYTDFAQIEADRTRINLTRFSLYYPEKRDFFLEGAGTFSFGRRETSVFYSRRIGITPDRKQVPILGGIRLSGKAGHYRVGILNMQTKKKDTTPATNYSVIRIKRDVLEKSYVGFILTNLYNADKHKNQAFGVDFSYRTNKFLKNNNLEVAGYLAGTVTDGTGKKNMAGRLFIDYPNDLFDNYAGVYFIEENFNPEIGFVRRKGIIAYYTAWRYMPRPKIPLVRKITIKPIDIDYLTDMNGRLLTRGLEFRPLGVSFKSGDSFEFNIKNSYEYLDKDFNIFGDVVIPSGTYEWWNNEIQFESSSKRPISIDLKTEWGDFYTGKRTDLSTDITFKFSENFALSTSISYNKISVSGISFETKEYSGRLVVNFSTRLTSRTFVQWNNEDKQLNLNFLLNYIPKIGSDIYFVYNHLWDGTFHYRTQQKLGIVKIAYLFRF